MNAVLVKGDALGTSLYYGAGAGDEATASAVIADLIDIINNQTSNHILGWKSQEKLKVLDADLIESEFYMRLLVSDKRGVLAEITQIFSQNNVSIESLVQKQVDGDNNAHIAIITNKILTRDIQAVKLAIEACEFNQDSVKIIHIESLD
jgi:homoserine dehydrogenase